jgi:hypothetical protein
VARSNTCQRSHRTVAGNANVALLAAMDSIIGCSLNGVLGDSEIKLRKHTTAVALTRRETGLMFETHAVLSARGKFLVALHWFAGCASRIAMRLPNARTLDTSNALFVCIILSSLCKTAT